MSLLDAKHTIVTKPEFTTLIQDSQSYKQKYGREADGVNLY